MAVVISNCMQRKSWYLEVDVFKSSNPGREDHLTNFGRETELIPASPSSIVNFTSARLYHPR